MPRISISSDKTLNLQWRFLVKSVSGVNRRTINVTTKRNFLSDPSIVLRPHLAASTRPSGAPDVYNNVHVFDAIRQKFTSPPPLMQTTRRRFSTSQQHASLSTLLPISGNCAPDEIASHANFKLKMDKKKAPACEWHRPATRARRRSRRRAARDPREKAACWRHRSQRRYTCAGVGAQHRGAAVH